MFQIGAEIVGDASAAADAAVLRLAAAVVRAFDVRPVVVFNDVSIAASFDDETRNALVTKGALRNIPTLGTLGDAGTRLRELQSLLGDDDAFVLQLDDLDATNGYYTGLRFRVYDAATRTRIAEGGRYDDLYARFGTPAAAVGLTFTIDDLD
jgi:ATP phosphoribosyltransferase regulatory subunit HisZ